MRILQIAVPLLIVLLMACAAFADDYETSYGNVSKKEEFGFYVGGFLGDSFIFTPNPPFAQVDAVFNDHITAGGRFAYFFNSYFGAEFSAGYTPANILGKTTFNSPSGNIQDVIDIHTWLISGNAIVHLTRGRVIPFVTGGVGAALFSLETNEFGLTPSESDFAWNVGGGVKIPVTHDIAARFDAREFWVNPSFSDQNTLHFTELSGGITFLFEW
jgi:opacity protein-like surface antigen